MYTVLATNKPDFFLIQIYDQKMNTKLIEILGVKQFCLLYPDNSKCKRLLCTSFLMLKQTNTRIKHC